MKISPNHLSAAFAAFALLALVGCTGDHSSTASGASSTSAATISGATISDEAIEVIAAEQRAQGAPEDPDMKDNIRKELVRRALLEQDAIKAGVNKRSDTLVRQDLARQTVLIRDYIQDWPKNNMPTDDELMKEYESIRARLGDQKEYLARHILLKTEQEAKTTISKLGKGAKFEDLARKSSLDTATKESGGDLKWSIPDVYAPPFSEAMVKLSKGEYTKAPVKTDFGFHIILLEDVRDLQHPTFEEVKLDMQQRVQQQRWQEYIEQLEKKVDANIGKPEESADEKDADEKDADVK